MPSPSLYETLPAPAVPAAFGLAALWRRLCAWHARVGEQRRQHRAERALAEMSLHGLRDIGAPEPLLQRRHLLDEARRLERRAWMQPPG